MPKKLCILHGNCQGDVLAILLGHSEEFTKNFDILRVVNYQKRQIDPGDLSRCSLFLYQHLGSQWGENASENLCGRLPPGSESICFPNMFFQGYWPFWRKDETIIEFVDSFLEMLLAKNLPVPALLNLYRKCDPALAGDISGVPESTLRIEREKEKHSDIKYVHLIEENWQKKQLFLTINHPAMPLHVHVANSVLNMLGFKSLKTSISDNIPHPYDEFWLPIHPVIGARLSLPFVNADRKYNCFSHKLTHDEYTRVYLACRMNNVSNLAAALSQIHIDKTIGKKEIQQQEN